MGPGGGTKGPAGGGSLWTLSKGLGDTVAGKQPTQGSQEPSFSPACKDSQDPSPIPESAQGSWDSSPWFG